MGTINDQTMTMHLRAHSESLHRMAAAAAQDEALTFWAESIRHCALDLDHVLAEVEALRVLLPGVAWTVPDA